MKQLKTIHKKNSSAKELKLIGTSLHQNVVDCMKSLLAAARAFGYDDFTAEDRKTETMLNAHDETDRLTPELGRRIEALFHSPTIQKTFDRRAEYWLLDAFQYYVKNLDRFTEPDFLPNEEDCVMARVRTTGIVNTELEQPLVKTDANEPDVLKFQVVDVGGQRNGRSGQLQNEQTRRTPKAHCQCRIG